MMPRNPAIIAVSALLIWVSVAAAEDQESRFTYHPSLLITGVGDDDPYLEERDDGAFGSWIAPNLELGYRADFYELQADLGADVRRYLDDGGDLSEEFYRAIVNGEIGVLPGLTLRVSNAFSPQPERVSSPADATRNLQQTNQVDAEVRYWRELPGRRELLMTFRGAHFIGEDFNAVRLTDGNDAVTHLDFEPDHWEGASQLELQTPFGERNSLYARSEFEYRTYSESAVPDRGEFAILVGVRSRYFRNVEIDVAAGFGMVTFESNDDLHRFVGEGSLRYRLPNGWTLRASAANRFVTEPAFVSRLENDAWNVRKNLFGGAEFRIQSRIGRHTVVAITYRYWDNAGDFWYWDNNRSTMLTDDFSQDRVTLEFFYRR